MSLLRSLAGWSLIGLVRIPPYQGWFIGRKRNQAKMHKFSLWLKGYLLFV